MAAPEVVPLVSQAMYEMATECLGKEAWTNKNEYSLEVDLAAMDVRSADGLSTEIHGCLKGKAEAIHIPLKTRGVEFLTVFIGSRAPTQ